MFHKQIHVLLSLSFQSSHRKVNIVLSIDYIRTLANVVIVDPTQVYLILHVASYCEVVATVVT
jgi:hypothetical protein